MEKTVQNINKQKNLGKFRLLFKQKLLKFNTFKYLNIANQSTTTT